MNEHPDRIVALLERIAVAVEALVPTEKPSKPDGLVTAREFADLLGVDQRTLRALRHAGDVPKALRIGRSPRWKRSTIERWLGQRQQ